MKYENLKIYRGKKVLITGNTGFKGSWLTSILLELDADLVGYSLEAPTSPSIYEQLGLKNKIKQYTNDVRSIDDLTTCLSIEKPEIIFQSWNLSEMYPVISLRDWISWEEFPDLT